MKKTTQQSESLEKITTLNGMMTFGKAENMCHILSFDCTEPAEVEPFVGDCKVQAMRDGNVYITEKAKRHRNKALFREDNSTLTLGRDGQYYFNFILPKKQAKELAEKLVKQAMAIADKFEQMTTKKKGGKR